MSLAKMNSQSAQRLELLNKMPEDQDTYHVIKWLQEGGQSRFENQVFAPPIMSLAVKDKSYTAIVDGCFRKSDLMVLRCVID